MTEASYERRAQLQTALDTRVVIEQAKGILAERHELELEEAFQLLRRAARSNRVKIRELAARIRPGCETPPELSAPRRLAPPGSRQAMLVTERTNERIEHNRVFRDVNQRIRAAARRYEHELERIPFLCESPVEDCVGVVRLTEDDYSAIRGNPRHFFTAPGHEVAEESVGRWRRAWTATW